MPLFSIIIPTCQRNELLERCLRRLDPKEQGSPSEEGYELLVTDDSPDEGARQLVDEKFPWASWVRGPRRGPAANRNSGARYARGEWLLFSDDDCLPDSALLAAYAAAISDHPRIRVFEGRTYASGPQKSLAESCPINDQGGNLWSCNFVIRRSLFEAMGGFDERFPYAAMEDVEFCLRLKQMGEQFLFVPEAAVAHPWVLRNPLDLLRRYETSLKVFLALHPEEVRDFSARKICVNNLRKFLKETLPGAIRFGGAGLLPVLGTHISAIGMAWRLRSKRGS